MTNKITKLYNKLLINDDTPDTNVLHELHNSISMSKKSKHIIKEYRRKNNFIRRKNKILLVNKQFTSSKLGLYNFTNINYYLNDTIIIYNDNSVFTLKNIERSKPKFYSKFKCCICLQHSGFFHKLCLCKESTMHTECIKNMLLTNGSSITDNTAIIIDSKCPICRKLMVVDQFMFDHFNTNNLLRIIWNNYVIYVTTHTMFNCSIFNAYFFNNYWKIKVSNGSCVESDNAILFEMKSNHAEVIEFKDDYSEFINYHILNY